MIKISVLRVLGLKKVSKFDPFQKISKTKIFIFEYFSKIFRNELQWPFSSILIPDTPYEKFSLFSFLAKNKKIFLYWVSQKCSQRVRTKFFEKKFHRGIRNQKPDPYRVKIAKYWSRTNCLFPALDIERSKREKERMKKRFRTMSMLLQLHT